MLTRRIVVAGGLALLLGAASTQAGSSLTRINHLTFNGPVELPGVAPSHFAPSTLVV